MLCEYGCGQEANFQLKCGKWCCSENYQGCISLRQNNSECNKNRKHSSHVDYHYHYDPCRYCSKEIIRMNIKRHEQTCYLNPINIKLCPICNKPIQRKSETCSYSCSNQLKKRGTVIFNKKTSYRSICFQQYDYKCIICGETGIVEVHHYDGNHQNHDPKNLVPLCPTHHRYTISKKHHPLIKEQIDNFIKTANII